jgi:phosphoribosyl-ATP pyrophosphohydrolase/phosphoribosyl-AMP cyclohydrolase
MRHLRAHLNWKKGGGLIPAIVQDLETGVVLMQGYMDKEALERTIETKRVWFYSRSKRRLWMKGETSGHVLDLVSLHADCDNDALLLQVVPHGPTCHTGAVSCFANQKTKSIFNELYEVIAKRKTQMPAGSYTTSLFSAGLDKICAKVEEESEETIHAAERESKMRLIEESVDLLYHLFVLLVQRDVNFAQLVQEIRKRRRP